MSNYRKTMTKALQEMYPLDESVIDKVKQIASKKSAAKIDGVMVDSFTASAISQIYDKVNDANKKKMDSLPITKLANLAFKMMNKEEVQNEQLAKIKGNTPADKGRKSAVEDDIKRAEKKGDKKEVEKLKEEDLDEAQDGGDFKPHMMYDPKTGKGYKADTMDDHLKMKKMGYTHDAPKTEEVDLGEEWTIVMPPAEGGKTVTGLDSMQAFSFVKSKGGKDRDMQSIKKGKNVTFQGKTGAFYKVIKEGLGVAEEVDLDEGGMKDLLIKAQELMGPSKNRKEGIQMVAKGLKVSEKEATKLVDAVIKMNEEVDLDEGKMSQLHQYIKDKKSAEQIAKLMKVDVATIKKLMSSHHPEDVEEGAAADARRAMSKDKDLRRGKDSADDDDNASDDDVKAASKNIMMQMRKAISLRGRFDVEFADGKKVKIPAKMAQLATKKYSEKKPADKEKFQAKIGKSYRDMLSALKEELQPQKESILERMNRKLKENKDG